MTLLTLDAVQASYGNTAALFDINLSINPGEVVALMGRNGMGKSTTVKTICRMLPVRGVINFNGHDLAKLPSHKAAQLGIGLVPEGRRCFGNLTVKENLISAARRGPWTVGKVAQLFPRLGERQAQRAASLSGGEQQMLAIGRALMTNPRLLILDEATEGLAPTVRQEIWSTIRRLKKETDVAILLIDKSVQELRSVCDKAVLIERGSTVWDGVMNDLTPTLLEKHVGV